MWGALCSGMLMSLTTGTAAAMFRGMSYPELVQKSDVIVVATLTRVTGRTEYGIDISTGTLVVSDVLWGSPSPGDTLEIEWRNMSRSACRVEFNGHRNQPAVWLLAGEDGGPLSANHPSRAAPVDQLTAVRRALEDYPFRVNVQAAYAPGEPVNVSILFRNATENVLRVPRLDWGGDTLRCGRGLRLKLLRRGESSFEPVSLGDAKIVRYADSRPVELAPGQSIQTRFPLDRVVDLSRGLYRLIVRLNETQEKCYHWLALHTEWEARVDAVRNTDAWVPFLRAILRGEEEGDVTFAIMSLQWVGPPLTTVAAPELNAAFADGDVETRRLVLRALPWIDRSLARYVDTVTAALRDDNENLRTLALGTLRTMTWDVSSGDQATLLALVFPLLEDESSAVRSAAVAALTRAPWSFDLESALDRMIDWDPDEGVRRQAFSVQQQRNRRR